MSRPHRDTRGYYRALGVSPRATGEEIRLAYEMLTGAAEPDQSDFGMERPAPPDPSQINEIERAWLVLKTPARRRQYDQQETAGYRFLGMSFKLDDSRVLAACVVLLVGILAFVWVPLYGSRFRSFSPGDHLVDTSGRPFGAIVRTEERHPFPGGITAEGYLVEESGSRELRWYPANDIRALCRKSPS